MPTARITAHTEQAVEDASLAQAGFYWRERAGVRVLVCAPLEAAGFANGFSTRTGGVSPLPERALNLAGFHEDAAENIHENRRRLLQLFEGEWRLATCWQAHGADVHVVPGDDTEQHQTSSDTMRCDALVTDATGVLLGVKTADCVPVLLGDRSTGATAAVHAGWRGTLGEIVPAALDEMRNGFGTEPGDVVAAIGAAAGRCCYEVGADVIEAFQQRFGKTAAELFTPTRHQHALVDLHLANRRQLIAAGVSVEHIHIAPLCTMCRTDLFFSYRREKKVHGRVGRLLAVIGRKS